MGVESIWADRHRIMHSRNGGRPEVIAMCRNSSVALMLAFAWNLEKLREQEPIDSEAILSLQTQLVQERAKIESVAAKINSPMSLVLD